jgi:hypothetical protein
VSALEIQEGPGLLGLGTGTGRFAGHHHQPDLKQSKLPSTFYRLNIHHSAELFGLGVSSE